MRTTVTLDKDLHRQLLDEAHRSGRPFKQVLNEAVRSGLRKPRSMAPFKQPVFSLGRARVDLTKSAALAGELEDLETIAKLQQR